MYFIYCTLFPYRILFISNSLIQEEFSLKVLPGPRQMFFQKVSTSYFVGIFSAVMRLPVMVR